MSEFHADRFLPKRHYDLSIVCEFCFYCLSELLESELPSPLMLTRISKNIGILISFQSLLNSERGKASFAITLGFYKFYCLHVKLIKLKVITSRKNFFFDKWMRFLSILPKSVIQFSATLLIAATVSVKSGGFIPEISKKLLRLSATADNWKAILIKVTSTGPYSASTEYIWMA